MSLKSREARFTAAAAAVALSTLAVASPASALNVGDPGTAAGQLNYQCVVPIIGEQPVEANVKSNIPLTWPAGTATPAFDIAVDARAKGDTYLGLQLVGVSSLVGKGAGDNLNGGSTKARIQFPTAAGGTGTLNLSIKIAIPQTTVPATDPGAAGVAIGATGKTPPVSFPAPGTASIFVDSIALSLQAKDASGAPIADLGDAADSDKDPLTFDLPCTGPSVKLADINITGPTTPTPAPVTPAPVTPAPVTPAPVTPAPVTPAPVTPAPVTPAPVTPTPGPVTPAPPAGTVNYGYSIAGTAILKGLTAGTINVTGSGKYNLTLATGAVTGNTKINPANAKLQALRFLPVTASINFLEVGSTTGSLKDQTLVATTKQSLQLKNVKVFGINLVSNTCRTVSPSSITLKSGTGAFKPLSGGTISGTFAISQLTSCGALGGLVSGLTASSGNPISVKLTNSN